MEKNYISKNLAYLVSSSRTSMDEFGTTFGLKRGIISQYIREISAPKIETLIKISDHYNISLDDLVRYDIEEKKKIVIKNNQNALGEIPEGYGMISLKYVELLEKSNEDKDKLIVAYEQKLGLEKNKVS